jgi:hypothetical protein
MGCDKAGKLDQPSAFTPPAGPVELKLKWPLGEHVVYEMTMKMNSEFTVPGQSTPMKQEMTMGQEYGLTVFKALPDGGHEVEMEFLNARMKMGMGGKTMMDYDSRKKSSAEKADPVGDIFGKIVGAKIQYFLNASNEVDRLEGINELMQRLSSGPQAAALAPLKSMFSDGYFKQMMSQNRFVPPKPVQPGDTWPVQMEFPMGGIGTMGLDYKFTFQSWEKHGLRECARLEFEGTIKNKPDLDQKANPSGMSIGNLDGTTSGTSWFDPELGIIIDTTMNQDISMVMNMSMPGKGGAGSKQSITNQMNQVMSIKLSSVK